MAYTLQPGSKGFDAELINEIVQQTAAQEYKFKQAVAIVPTSNLDVTFFREDPTVLTASGNANIKGVPFGAAFPQVTAKHEKLSKSVIKFADEVNIAWEFLKGSAINILSRQLIKSTEAVVKSVDDYIFDELTESRDFAKSLEIQSYSISSDKYWNGTSSAIIFDIGYMKRLIGQKNYPTNNLLLFVSPRDNQSIADYLHSKGSQYQSLGEDMARNGRVGKVAGVTLVESNSVTASFALMVVPKTCATYYEFESLKSTTTEDPYKSLRIRVVEEGVVTRDNPLAIVLLRGTQGVHLLN